MNERELKEYIDNAVRRAVEAKKKPNPRALSPTRHKWFEDEDGSFSTAVMGKAFDNQGYITSQIWDNVRPIVMKICGKTYVREIAAEDEPKLNDIADKLCQCIYDLRQEWMEYKDESIGCLRGVAKSNERV